MKTIKLSYPALWIEGKLITQNRSNKKTRSTWPGEVKKLRKVCKDHGLKNICIHSNYDGKSIGDDSTIAVTFESYEVSYIFCCDTYYSPTENLRECINAINSYYLISGTKAHYVKIKRDEKQESRSNEGSN